MQQHAMQIDKTGQLAQTSNDKSPTLRGSNRNVMQDVAMQSIYNFEYMLARINPLNDPLIKQYTVASDLTAFVQHNPLSCRSQSKGQRVKDPSLNTQNHLSSFLPFFTQTNTQTVFSILNIFEYPTRFSNQILTPLPVFYTV